MSKELSATEKAQAAAQAARDKELARRAAIVKAQERAAKTAQVGLVTSL